MIRLIAYGAVLAVLTWVAYTHTPARHKPPSKTQFEGAVIDVAYHFPDSDRWPDVQIVKKRNRELKQKLF